MVCHVERSRDIWLIYKFFSIFWPSASDVSATLDMTPQLSQEAYCNKA